MRGAVFVDGRNHLDPALMTGLGFDYVDFGRAAEPTTSAEGARGGLGVL